MQTILDLLHKIKWDPRERPEDYTLLYEDRIEKKHKEIAYADIKRIEGTFVILENDGEEVNIPLHRFREVRRKGKLIWKR